MDLTAYQSHASGTAGPTALSAAAIGGDEKAATAMLELMYYATGLVGEAGEVCGAIKKMFRDDLGTLTQARRDQLRSELGDVLWYLAAIATECELDLSNIACDNMQKLARRADAGTIRGDGDDR